MGNKNINYIGNCLNFGRQSTSNPTAMLIKRKRKEKDKKEQTHFLLPKNVPRL